MSGSAPSPGYGARTVSRERTDRGSGLFPNDTFRSEKYAELRTPGRSDASRLDTGSPGNPLAVMRLQRGKSSEADKLIDLIVRRCRDDLANRAGPRRS